MMIQRLKPCASVALTLALAATAFGQNGMLANPGDLTSPPSVRMDAGGALAPQPRANAPTNSGGNAPSPFNFGAESIDLGEVLSSETPGPFDPTNGFRLEDAAPLESTGTWLQRGYWYAEEDVVLFNRQWSKESQPVLLASEFGTIARRLKITPNRPGVFANSRITLGRFLFRDDENRDHFTEFTYLGGGRSELDGMTIASAPNNLSTPPFIDNGYIAFDNSNAQNFKYVHDLHGLEYNFRVKKRMERDQMVLLPDGQWVRRAAPTWTREFLGGIRWLAIDEWLEWEAFGDNESANRNGSMDISTDNNLLGFQVGGGLSREWARFSLSSRSKAGVYVNFTDVTRDYVVRVFNPANGANPATNEVVGEDHAIFEEELLAFIGQSSLIARYHIHQNFSLRFSGELMFVNGLAVAPQQVTFATGKKSGNTSGYGLFMGFGFGVEGYW